jgi:hypothetical protein
MIWTPDRLAELVASVESGAPVDLHRLAQLQALDLVRAGRAFVVEAIERQEAADEQYRAAAS